MNLADRHQPPNNFSTAQVFKESHNIVKVSTELSKAYLFAMLRVQHTVFFVLKKTSTES